MRVAFGFLWYDFWIGAFYNRTQRRLYIAPLPMMVFSFEFRDMEAEQ